MVGGDGGDGAAMEPAIDRREHSAAGRRRVLLADAAMEPAIDRREHDWEGGTQGSSDIAAMEPAIDRREHRQVAVGTLAKGSPQWSPPLIGGSTPL